MLRPVNSSNSENPEDLLTLARHAAVSWIEQSLSEDLPLVRVLALASERFWGGKLYSASTLEAWFYAYRAGGFAALQRKPRKDKGSRKALSPEAIEALLQLRRQHPQLTVQVLVRRLVEQGRLQRGTFSMPSVYRVLAAHALDRRSLRHAPPPLSGPTKAFETPHANELWMADLMFGPTLKLASGQVLYTRLFALLDDCSRLIPHAQYYLSEDLSCFLDCFRQALSRRGLPHKLYTDRGKIFTSQHLQIVCANLQIRLLHAKPYAAWSRGKLERFFRTLQEDFEARLVLEPVPTLDALNQRLWRWLEVEYHQRPHRGLEGQSPAERFSARAVALRTADPHTDWQRLFLHRAQRRVRLDATVSLEGRFWEVPPHLRGRIIQLRFDPFAWQRVEIWIDDRYVGLAKLCNKQLNSKTYSSAHYERPDQSFPA